MMNPNICSLPIEVIKVRIVPGVYFYIEEFPPPLGVVDIFFFINIENKIKNDDINLTLRIINFRDKIFIKQLSHGGLPPPHCRKLHESFLGDACKFKEVPKKG